IFAAVSTATTVGAFALLRGYARYWLFASLPEVVVIGLAAFVAQVLTTTVAFSFTQIAGLPTVPRSVPVIAVFLSASALALPRLALRSAEYYRLHRQQRRAGNGKRVLIAGAGDAGWSVMREIQKNPQLGLVAVGFVDDDPNKHGLWIQGVPVLGATSDIPRLAKAHRIAEVLIAIPSATADQMRTIVGHCRAARVQALTLPGMRELLNDQVKLQRFRPVAVEDLLARAPVRTDTSAVRALLAGRTVLVTGAGGSIGSELCRQIAASGPALLLLLGHGETSVFYIHNELRERFPDVPVLPVIADTRDSARVTRILTHYRPDFIFHAAAHKHVPLMETNPEEAVTNNVGGTWNLLRAAEVAGCPNFVMISTDKAVNPTSVMGATKRVAEKLVQLAAVRSGRCYVAVRFGNVLGSRGSVVPLFEAQIRKGGPITVTHPEVRRYFMTIPEAVGLVLQAAALGRGGEIFVLDMGKPIKIVDLAREMIRLAGLEEGKDIEIEFTGLRPGEKLFEELFLEDEEYGRTAHQKIFICRNGASPDDGLEPMVTRLLGAAEAGDQAAVFHLLHALVPECAAELGSTPGPRVLGDTTAEAASRASNGAGTGGNAAG
ncbi:MAG: polysaccharide biosynthesis protein, partial [Armatimonadetes bacterium]|nr:polysaccharide biosynthesis protein [Armatimonadota bacterium]